MSGTKECPSHLVYITDEEPGYTRKKWGRGFMYWDDVEDKKIEDNQLLKRIKDLVIPPMWSRVWISPHEHGHLQVTGYDQKGRKQYIYHQDWTKYRQDAKYSKLVEFGSALPTIRRKVNEHINLRGWPKRKILALIVKLLDEHYIRIGNRHYVKQNKTYGLTTLRRKHIEEKNGKFFLSYKAKSGKYRNVQILNKKLIRIIRKISELPGYEIFKYKDEANQVQKLDSQEVNRYLEEVSGDCFTAKDFRTWGGTVLALDCQEAVKEEVKENPKLNLETNIVRRVAQTLGNTVSVCREYYIHPKVLKVIVSDKLSRYKQKALPKTKYKRELSASEVTALKIIAN